jgi:hypothetical protein
MYKEESCTDKKRRSRAGVAVIRLTVVIAGTILFAAVALCAEQYTSPLTCPQGLKLGIYDSPKEGTKPWRDKHVRCEKIDISCPLFMKPVYHDTEVYGATPLDNGKFVRCEEINGPPN